jgi:hypothetical protein
MTRLTQFNFPQTVYMQLEEEKNAFEQKLEAAEEPATRTKVSVAEKNEARKKLESDIRQSVAEFLIRNHLLTNADHELLELPIRKTTRTPVPQPTEKVDFTIEQLGGSRLIVHFHAHDEERSAKNTKPSGVHGAELVWDVSTRRRPRALGVCHPLAPHLPV